MGSASSRVCVYGTLLAVALTVLSSLPMVCGGGP